MTDEQPNNEQPNDKQPTDQTDKGNGGAKESTITIKFPAMGAADPTILPRNVTPGQFAVAGVWLFGWALFDVFTALKTQQAQMMQQQKALEAIMRGGKLK